MRVGGYVLLVVLDELPEEVVVSVVLVLLVEAVVDVVVE